MKNWGLVLVVCYGLLIFALLFPAIALVPLASGASDDAILAHWGTWLCAVIVIGGEVLLFWLSVDTSHRRLKPRTHILISFASAALFMAILTVGVVVSVRIAIQGDHAFPNHTSPWVQVTEVVAAFVVPWLVWCIVFYRLWKNQHDPITRSVAWLFRGSVLELLVAVPAHVISRRRDDCCAPLVSGIGISCGIAIMLLSFGPSVLMLFKKRMERYQKQSSGASGQGTEVPGSH